MQPRKFSSFERGSAVNSVAAARIGEGGDVCAEGTGATARRQTARKLDDKLAAGSLSTALAVISKADRSNDWRIASEQGSATINEQLKPLNGKRGETVERQERRH